MKFLTRLLLLLMAIIILYSCKKNELPRDGKSSFNIVNVISGGGEVVFNQVPTVIVPNKSAKVLTTTAGDHLYISAYSPGYPSAFYFGVDLSPANGDYFTLLLSGSAESSVDAFFYKETNIPVFKDSTMAVRFINLVKNGPPITVNLVGAPAGSAQASLAYQGIGAFKNYPATYLNTIYHFEIRDAGSGNLLGTYALNTPRFFSCTLVWNGRIGGIENEAPAILKISHQNDPVIN